MEHQGHSGVDARQEDERQPPAERVREDPANDLPSDHPKDGPRQQPCQRRLASSVWDSVADPRHGEGDDGGGSPSGEHSESDEPAEGGCDCRPHAPKRAGRRGQRDHPAFAVAVAERPVHELEQAIGDRKGGDRVCRIPRRCLERLGQLRQQRIADAHRGGTRKPGEGEQRDRAPAKGVGFVQVLIPPDYSRVMRTRSLCGSVRRPHGPRRQTTRVRPRTLAAPHTQFRPPGEASAASRAAASANQASPMPSIGTSP